MDQATNDDRLNAAVVPNNRNGYANRQRIAVNCKGLLDSVTRYV